MPQTWCGGVIIPIYKSGGRSDQANYLGIYIPMYIRSRKKAHFGRRALYYSNSTATTQLLLLTLSGNVESNPSPQGSHNNSSKTLCAYYAKAMRRNQNGVRCSSCLAVFHNKCTKMSKNELSYCRREGTWICFTGMPQFSDSFFDDLSPSTAYDLSSNGEDFEIVEEHSVDSVDWFSRNVNGYYKSNLKIAYFNVNSLQHKLDETTPHFHTSEKCGTK
ncbi:unnamed protein product [Porites lobata]|uniref:Phorbol-ester/DAG-type domain-containing protein n=1 Tax=Porites lobata TaxID=104759 RepID=A0ABN8PX17_9CNID|nr:unnamed protein product [Porites lobata]